MSESDKAELFDKIRNLCGFIEDGGGATVSIYQDDCTRDWFVRVGKKYVFASSLKAAIEKAYDQF